MTQFEIKIEIEMLLNDTEDDARYDILEVFELIQLGRVGTERSGDETFLTDTTCGNRRIAKLLNIKL